MDNRVLLGRRSPSRAWYPNVWDLPGGHVEQGESEPQALIREMWEELGVHVLEHDPEPEARIYLAATGQRAGMEMRVWRVREWRGVVANRCPDEHDELRWCAAGDLGGLALAHPSYCLLLHTMLRP